MYTIRTLNNISPLGLANLPEKNFTINDAAENPDGIILRSFDMHHMELNPGLLAVARAGAGTNNIPIDRCTEQGVPVFNTPGANANAVKELVLAGLLVSSRRIVAGSNWVQSLKDSGENIEKAVEAGKKNYTGPEISGFGHERHRLRPLPVAGIRLAPFPRGRAGRFHGRCCFQKRLHHPAYPAERKNAAYL